VIGSLAGIITAREPPRLLLEVQGVGYEVEVPMSTYLALPPAGTTVRLRIHHVVREDASLLFGFATDGERELFRALLKVNGVGPKVALAVLSGVSADAFAAAVATDDVAALTRIPGVGRKTAERLLVEMRDHFKDRAAAGAAVAHEPRAEALHALQALGYKPQEAQRMLEKVDATAATTEDLIRGALLGASLKEERR
jgi:Holliday junction DNA helicase RuvA